jgi:hypothetical protein
MLRLTDNTVASASCFVSTIDSGSSLYVLSTVARTVHRHYQWSDHEPQGGHQFQHVQVTDGARAHLRDTYNISQFLADAKEEYRERLTGYRSRKPA